MGLAERRASKEFLENRFPDLKKRIDQEAKFEVALEVKWDTLAVEGQAEMYDECWVKVYFQPLIAALKSICRDELGQEALRSELKQIIIQNTNGNYSSSSWANFQKGILVLDHEPITNVDYVEDRTKELITNLEKGL
jgi:hypothetical protein